MLAPILRPADAISSYFRPISSSIETVTSIVKPTPLCTVQAKVTLAWLKGEKKKGLMKTEQHTLMALSIWFTDKWQLLYLPVNSLLLRDGVLFTIPGIDHAGIDYGASLRNRCGLGITGMEQEEIRNNVHEEMHIRY